MEKNTGPESVREGLSGVAEFARMMKGFVMWFRPYSVPEGRLKVELEQCATLMAESTYVNERFTIEKSVLCYCESEIERLLGMHLYAELFSEHYSLNFLPCQLHDWKKVYSSVEEWARWTRLRSTALGGVCVFMQAPVGKYRVDFLMAGMSSVTGPIHWLAVECDGHEFHEKTKEQAAHDRARDRYITEQGISVMRFTGSEVWSDPRACAVQAARFVTQRLSAELPEFTE